MAARKDLTGKKFGRLTPIKMIQKTTKNGTKCIYWECMCDCGNTCTVKSASLTRKKRSTKSCGCLKEDQNSKNLICDLSTEGRILNYKISRRNTSGVKGVTYSNKQKIWIAQISYHNNHYYLTSSKDIDECIAIRKEAEKAVKDGTFDEWIIEYKGN